LKPNRTALLSLALILCSCGFISFEGISIASFPSTKDQIIAEDDPIALEFSISPDKRSAEKLLRITTPDGLASGDYSWSADRMSFTPRPALPAGRRIVLSFSGSLDTADGRTFSVDLEIPFFVGTAAAPPRLTGYEPEDAAVVGVTAPIMLTFSDPMDADGFARNFSLSPSLEYDIRWDAAGRVATISPRTQWSSLSLHTWEVGAETKSAAGVLIEDSAEGSFLVQEDDDAPAVVRTQPARLQNGAFVPVDFPLNGNIENRDCIMMSFTEDVDAGSLSTAFSLEPSVQGHFVRVSEGVFVFVPEADYLMGRNHVLRLSTDLADAAGNRMMDVYSEWFVPDIPPQGIVSILPLSDPPMPAITTFNSPAPIAVTLPATPGDELTFTIVFQVPFEDEESRARVPAAVLCEGFFPASLFDPSMRSVSWSGNDTVTITYAGLETGAAPDLKYYLLTIPGGVGGIPNGSGSFLEEDVWILIIAY
jgi:hypothetical protein